MKHREEQRAENKEKNVCLLIIGGKIKRTSICTMDY